MLWGGGGIIQEVTRLCTIQGGYGIGDNGLEKKLKFIAQKLVFHPFPNKSCLSGTLSVYAEIQV